MVRRIKVFAVLLFASCFFSFSAFAEFTVNDSNNLLNIRSTLSNVNQYLGTLNSNIIWAGNQTVDVKNSLVSLRNNLDANFSSLLTDTTNLQSQLTTISSLLSSLVNDKAGNYFVSEFANNTQYMTDWSTGNSGTNAGYIFPNTSASAAYKGLQGLTLLPGTYRITVLASYAWDFANQHYEAGTKSVIRTFTSPQTLKFNFYGAGYYYISIVPATSSDEAQSVVSNVGSNITGSTSSVNSGVDQLEGLENQVFGSLDTSLGSIDFSGSALGQVVSGFNFIRAVFSAVYSSSPYISVLINLSCMFGVLALFLRVQPRFSRWEREHRDRSS